MEVFSGWWRLVWRKGLGSIRSRVDPPVGPPCCSNAPSMSSCKEVGIEAELTEMGS